MSTIIAAEAITKEYRRGDRSVKALDRVSFQIEAGQRVALLGRSGSGKSTLLNLMAGLDRATEGSLTVAGRDLVNSSGAELDRFRQSLIGVVFQQFRLIKHRTAFQNVELPLIVAGLSVKERRIRVEECLQRVGLANRASHRPGEMSGGEQQRVAVARSIANRPQILLADEPTGNLDSHTASQIMELIREVQIEVNATLVLITHDHDLANSATDRILRITDGRLSEASASPESER